MKKIVLLVLMILVLVSCNFDNSKKQKTVLNNSKKEYNNFISRIHKSSYEIDWYKLLGKTTLNKHIEDFENINWENEYWEQYNSGKLNFPDIEVIDKENYMYLSVSICPKNENSYQFCIGAGIYSKISKKTDDVKRTIRIYATGTDNPEKVEEIIQLFFDRKPKELAKEIKRLDFMYELDDLYQNL